MCTSMRGIRIFVSFPPISDNVKFFNRIFPHTNTVILLDPSQSLWVNMAYRAFSLRWPASILIYWNKREHLHKKRAHLPNDFLATPP